MPKTVKKFVIIDGNALLHRAWHALPPLSTKDGTLVNAVYGFASIMLGIIKDLDPDYGTAAFDPPGKTFRHQVYAEYKGTREKQPDELYAQIPLIKEVAAKFGFKVIERPGFEADDVIGTLAAEAHAAGGIKTYIVTGDMDALQLVNKDTFVYTIKRGLGETVTLGIKEVKEKYGFGPEQLIEYKGLAGDSSDNIPGVAGVGDKTAKQLLADFKNLEKIYGYLAKNPGGGKMIKPRIAEKLLADKDMAILSRELATINRALGLDFNTKDFKISPAPREEMFELFRNLEFKSLLARAQKVLGSHQAARAEEVAGQESLFSAPKAAAREFSIRKGYHLVKDKKTAKALAAKLAKVKALAVDTETDGLGALVADLLGVSVCAKAGEAYYVVAEHAGELAEALANPKIQKYGHNIKYDIQSLDRAGLPLANVVFDTKIGAYLLRPGNRNTSLDDLSFSELKKEMVSIESLIGPRGKKQITLADVPLARVADYAAEDADYTFQLKEKIAAALEEENLYDLFQNIEMPLVPILAEMEKAGVKIDALFLENMSKSVGRDLGKLEKKIHQLAGTDFNVASPSQLKRVLFEDLGLSTAGIGKIKSGFSTAAGELEKLIDSHPIIPLILQHRELAKLKSTYLDALPKLVNQKTGRVHTSFNQTVATTGRLSSSDPNLQNIPMRTELGRSIRKAFIAESGNVLISADYSQIELRVAADLSEDKTLLEIFQAGKDIHTSTAAFVHNISEAEVTPEIRRTAKEVNFGVLYGMGPHGLATRTGMPYKRAKEFIDKYFARFSDLAAYLEGVKESARECGYVETKYGRKLALPDITSGVAPIRAAAERLATNMPIQGTAADIIKIAMIKICNELPKIDPKARLLMQVHDELVFEVPESGAEKTAEFIRQAMAGAVTLRVPVVATVHIGRNWQEAH